MKNCFQRRNVEENVLHSDHVTRSCPAGCNLRDKALDVSDLGEFDG